MSREQSTFRCKPENFEAIREKWMKLGYKVSLGYFLNDGTFIVRKYKIKEEE